MISQTTSYAARALALLEGPNGEFKLVSEIAHKAQIPSAFLSKIFGLLRRKRIIQSRRGVGGGVRLTKNPTEITLLKICEALDDEVLEHRCILNLPVCSDETACPGHKFWSENHKVILEKLHTITLQDMGESLMKKGFGVKVAQ